MRQSLLVALALLTWLGTSPGGAGLGVSSGQRPGATATEPAWSSRPGRESPPSHDLAPLQVLERKLEKDETEAPIGLDTAPDGIHKLVPPSHARSHEPRGLASDLRPPPRPARLRC